MQRPLSDEDRHPLAGVEDVGRGLQLLGGGDLSWRPPPHPGVHGVGLERLFGHGLHVLDVGRHDHAGDRAFGLGDAHRAVDHVTDRRGIGDLLDVGGSDVGVELEKVDLLLEVAAHRSIEGLADDGHHRPVVQLGVVEAVQQVDRARPRGGQADPDITGELGVAAGHERGHLLVTGLDEPQLVLMAAKRAEDAVDAVARESHRSCRRPTR